MATTIDVLDRDKLERTPAVVQLEPRPARRVGRRRAATRVTRPAPDGHRHLTWPIARPPSQPEPGAALQGRLGPWAPVCGRPRSAPSVVFDGFPLHALDGAKMAVII